MSNIDFSRLVTPQIKAAQAAVAHKEAVKSQCKQRILALFPVEAQQNIVQAMAFHMLEVGSVAARAGESAPTRLTEADIALALQGQGWIASMQTTCRILAADPDANLYADDVWPVLPEGLPGLIARF